MPKTPKLITVWTSVINPIITSLPYNILTLKYIKGMVILPKGLKLGSKGL
jgi:hypothetical protein